MLFTEARQRSGSGRVLQLQQSSVLSLPCCPGASGSGEDQDVLSCPWLGAPQSQHGSPPALVGTSAIPGQWQGAFVHTILLPSLSSAGSAGSASSSSPSRLPHPEWMWLCPVLPIEQGQSSSTCLSTTWMQESNAPSAGLLVMPIRAMELMCWSRQGSQGWLVLGIIPHTGTLFPHVAGSVEHHRNRFISALQTAVD